MGITKTDLYSEEQNRVALQLKAIAHPARIAILRHILKSNSCINSDLVQEIGLAQATISQHLKALKEAELIQGTIEGKAMCYCINPNSWEQLKAIVNNLFESYQSPPNTNCC
ncbi:winged helix-turn-helix transcriptional regulator [bacterium]|nr:winged helix-turn-helix transcriptional regulator [bacterium]